MLSTETISVDIPDSHTYDANGVAQAKTYGAPVNIRASVQPLRGADLAKLPEGELVTDWCTIYAATPMPTGARVVRADASVWEVRVANDWQLAGNFGKAMVKRS